MPQDRSVNSVNVGSALPGVVVPQQVHDVSVAEPHPRGAQGAGLPGRSASTAAMGFDEVAAMASPLYKAGRATDRLAAVAPVLVAVWCCSVGVTWTIELHQLDRGTALGTTVDWISSGVPTSQQQPHEDMARDLLAHRGLHLYPDSTAGPRTHSRHSIGYVCADAELIALAHRVRDVAAKAGTHPVTLAAHWVASGLSCDAGSGTGLRQRAQRPGMRISSQVAD